MNNKPTHFDENTPESVKSILQSELHSENRLRLFYGDVQTGKDWEEEYDVMGYIGRSTGTKPILLLINNKNSSGGPAILTNCIVKITKNGYTVYSHLNYHHEQHQIKPSSLDGYVEDVYGDDELTARFKKPGQAQKWVDFIEGAGIQSNKITI